MEPWQYFSRKVHRAIQVQAAAQTFRQGLDQVKQRRNAGERRNADIDSSVMVKEFPEQGQQDQRDGQRVQKHENRQRKLNDFGQSEVGNAEGKGRKDHRPDLVGTAPGKHSGKGIGTACHKANGGLQAGTGDGDRQDDASRFAEIVIGNLSQRDTTVFRDFKQAPGLGAHENGCDIDRRHQQAGQYAGMKDILGNCPVFLDPHAANNINNDNAECKTSNGVHGPIALDKTGEQRAALVCAVRLHRG